MGTKIVFVLGTGNLNDVVTITPLGFVRRCFDYHGGFDNYILNTPDRKLGFGKVLEIKRELEAIKQAKVTAELAGHTTKIGDGDDSIVDKLAQKFKGAEISGQ